MNLKLILINISLLLMNMLKLVNSLNGGLIPVFIVFILLL